MRLWARRRTTPCFRRGGGAGRRSRLCESFYASITCWLAGGCNERAVYDETGLEWELGAWHFACGVVFGRWKRAWAGTGSIWVTNCWDRDGYPLGVSVPKLSAFLSFMEYSVLLCSLFVPCYAFLSGLLLLEGGMGEGNV